MKNLKLLLAFLIGNSIYAQYDYYRWDRVPVNTCNSVTNGPIAIDQFDRVYYVRQSDQLIYHYDENLSYCAVLNANATKVRAGSNIIVNDDGVFYVGQNNKVCSLEWNAVTGQWDANVFPTLDVATSSQISVRNKNHIFYLKAGDNKIYNYWANSSASGNNVLNNTARPAVIWTNIIYQNGEVYYIGNNKKVSRLKWNLQSMSWLATDLPTDQISNLTSIAVRNENQIFYVRSSDLKIANYYLSSGSFVNGPLSEVGERAQIGTHLQFQEDHLFFVGDDDNPHVFVWQDCRWIDQTLNTDPDMNQSYRSFVVSDQGDRLFYFDNSNDVEGIGRVNSQGFVYKQGMDLMLDGDPYNPIGICYYTRIYHDTRDESWHIGPMLHSVVPPNPATPFTDRICLDEPGCRSVLLQHFTDMKNRGFNIVRFADVQVGVDVATFDKVGAGNYSDPDLYVKYSPLHDFDPSGYPLWTNSYKKVDSDFEQTLFDLYDLILDVIADVEGLKVNFYIGLEEIEQVTSPHQKYIEYAGRFAERFKDREEIAFYTVAFEADLGARITDKQYICSFIDDVYQSIRANDQNHLVTAGTIFESAAHNWDPGIFNVDVITTHLYPPGDLGFGSNDYMRSFERSINWTRNIITEKIHKPWIIGETGHLAWTNDPTQLMQQRDYAIYAKDNIFSCGSKAMFWWNYADVTNPAQSSYSLYGLYNFDDSEKPIIDAAFGGSPFVGFTPVVGCGPEDCVTPQDYFNTNNSKPHVITGLVTDINGKPIKDAVLVAQDVNVTKTEFTFTDANGNYTMKSQLPINTLSISAVGKERKQLNPQAGPVINVTLSDVRGCEAVPKAKRGSLESIGGTFDPDIEDVQIFPNPTSDYVTVSGEGIVKVEVYSIVGNHITIVDNIHSSEELKVDMKDYIKGVYIFEISTNAGLVTKKILRN